jgi:inosose dehydratase
MEVEMKFALNPLQWLATDDGWLDFQKRLPLETLLREVSRLGFTALHAEVPAGMSTADYRDTLAAAGITPASGYLSAPLDDVEEREAIVARAGALAEAHRELGLTEMFVASSMGPDAPRVAKPAVGAYADETRLGEIARTLELIGRETSKHGVTPCLHQHVGTWIETEDEYEWLLARLDPEQIALGPDTGHLSWAGIDPCELVRRHRDRVRAAHLKDIRLDVARSTRGTDATYKQVVAQGLWAEPGLGDLDLDDFLAALPDDFAGWVVIEVDKPSLATPEDSVAASARWVQSVRRATATA